MATLKDKVDKSKQQRAVKILTLGELAYKKMRKDEIQDKNMESIALEIVELDRNIFNSLKAMNEKTAKQRGTLCQCGASLNPEMKFCSKCGVSVNSPPSQDDIENTLICDRCGVQISISYEYCNCCGGKID